MVRVERTDKPSPSGMTTIRFRGVEWETSGVFNLESEVRERFGGVSPDEVVEITPPKSHAVLYLKVKELADLVWE